MWLGDDRMTANQPDLRFANPPATPNPCCCSLSAVNWAGAMRQAEARNATVGGTKTSVGFTRRRLMRLNSSVTISSTT